MSPEHHAPFIPLVDGRVARLGVPDQHWWSLAPPLRQLEAQVLSSLVRLSPVRDGAHSDSRAIYARTPKELAKLVSLLEDDALQDQVAAIDTRRRTVLLLRGVSQIESVRSVRIEQELSDTGMGLTIEHVMYIETDGASMAIGTVLTMDRLARTPAWAKVTDLRVSQTMIGDVPR